MTTTPAHRRLLLALLVAESTADQVADDLRGRSDFELAAALALVRRTLPVLTAALDAHRGGEPLLVPEAERLLDGLLS